MAGPLWFFWFFWISLCFCSSFQAYTRKATIALNHSQVAIKLLIELPIILAFVLPIELHIDIEVRWACHLASSAQLRVGGLTLRLQASRFGDLKGQIVQPRRR